MAINDAFLDGEKDHFSFSYLSFNKKQALNPPSPEFKEFVKIVIDISGEKDLNIGSDFNLLDSRLEKIISQLNDFSFYDLAAKAFLNLYQGDYSEALAYFTTAKSITEEPKLRTMCDVYIEICISRFKRTEEVVSAYIKMSEKKNPISIQFVKCLRREADALDWKFQNFLQRLLYDLDLFEKRTNKPNDILDVVEINTSYFKYDALKSLTKKRFDFRLFYLHTGRNKKGLYFKIPTQGKLTGSNQQYNQAKFLKDMDFKSGVVMLMGCEIEEKVIKENTKSNYVIYSQKFIHPTATNPFVYFFFREYYFDEDVVKAFNTAKELSAVFNDSASNLRLYEKA